ncbi:MAG: T9SS type A sorting domain-containing protein [Chitinophagales bacterium]|nr:T9SS type A sorting domain-containing protein [Chitinophagales bacterium]
MKYQINVMLAMLVLISVLIYQPTNAQQTLACEGVYEDIISSPIDLFIHGADLFIPDTDVLSIDITGGDGGDVIFAEFTCDTHIHGGTGASVQVSFEVGDEDGKLKPGGIIRTYRGERGGTRVTGCLNTGDEVSGAGGGATAIVYLPPLADAAGANWILLAVAGGGGGAVRPGPNKLDKVGGGAMAGKNGGNSSGSLGGTNSSCPEEEYCFIMDNRPGTGAGLKCAETASYEGKDVVLNHTPTDQAIIYVQLRPVNEYILTAGIGEGNVQMRGGFGFFGGGASGKGGGGGGGFHGGAVYCEEGGGGGGSYATDSFGSFDKTITPGVDGGTVDFPSIGKIKITTYKLAEAVCPPLTVTLDENGDGEFNGPDYLLNSSIPCGGSAEVFLADGNSYTELVEDVASFDCSDIERNLTCRVIIWDAQGGLASTCATNLTIEDDTPPDAICKNINKYLLPNGNVTIEPSLINDNSTDVCGLPPVATGMSLDITHFTCADIGANTVTLTVEDVNGNTAQCTSIVTIYDEISPIAICPSKTISLDASGNASVTPEEMDNGSTDACGIASRSLDITNFNCADVGEVDLILTVTDVNGNATYCPTSVIVEDNTPPNALCMDNWIYLDRDGTVSITPGHMNNGSNDACGIASLSLSQTDFTCADAGDNTLTLTVEDVNGNISQCTSILSVYDVDPPFWLCKNTAVELDATGHASITPEDIDDGSTDACGIASMTLNKTDFSCSDIGDNSVTMTLKDTRGNTSFCHVTVTVTEGKNLPTPWQSTNVGNVTIGNLFEYLPCTAPGEFSIIGSGNNATSITTDNVAFAHQSLCGDGTITAKIESIEPNGYGGLMIRETADDGAKQVSIFSNLSNTLRHEVRYSANTPKQVGSFFKPNPIWLRMERQGDWVFSYSSFDGINFQYVHGVFISMQNCVEVGLASFTYLPNAQTEAVFSNVSISGNNGSFSEEDSTIGTKPSKPSSTTLNPPSDITKNKVAPNPLSNWDNTARTGPVEGTPLNPRLFPNPTDHAFTLSFQQPLTNEVTVSLRNQVGQILEQRQLKAGETSTKWNVSELPNGLYFMVLQQVESKPQVLQVVIAR